MAMQYNENADTRNRVLNLERELKELRTYMEQTCERLERQVEENTVRLAEHSHYPLSPDYGKAEWKSEPCLASEAISKS